MRFEIPPKPWNELNEFDIADIILCTPDSHPDYKIKRVRLLREQGEDEFADLVEQTFDLSDAAAKRHEAMTEAIERWASQ